MKKKRYTINELLVAILIVALLLFVAAKCSLWVKKNAFRIICASNLRDLGKTMRQYANDYGGRYPTTDKWCDLLIENAGMRARQFSCREAQDFKYDTTESIDEANFPPVYVHLAREYNDVEGRHHYTYHVEWCHYAINPNARSNSPDDVVLLFETKGGWNQFGGLKILSTDNHLQSGGKGCNVLFNDGRVRFVKPKKLGKLKWKHEQNQ